MSPEYQLVIDELKYFLKEVRPNSLSYSPNDKMAAYTNSGDYLAYTTCYHSSDGMPDLIRRICELGKVQTVIDVGCCSGIAGLVIAQKKGWAVTFHDFEGLSLDFIRWFIEKHSLSGCQVVPYGGEIKRHDLAVALDVMEHTGNHLGFLRWVDSMARYKIICYPFVEFSPPFRNVMDEWIDDNVIRQVIKERYKMTFDYETNGRRFLAWES